jgi:hypothetical protein
MSPEHANGSDVDRRADVFAMGVVLWELATGRRLINGKLANQALKTLMDAEPLPRLSAASAEADPVCNRVSHCYSKYSFRIFISLIYKVALVIGDPSEKSGFDLGIGLS